MAYELKTKSLWVLDVDRKGVDSGIAADWLVEQLQVAGYGRVKVTLKSDTEVWIIALKTAIAARRKPRPRSSRARFESLSLTATSSGLFEHGETSIGQ